MSDPHPYLEIACRAMTLKANTPKNLLMPSWVGMSDAELDVCILNEIQELLDACQIGNSLRILDEACDVMAFAAMRADPARRNR